MMIRPQNHHLDAKNEDCQRKEKKQNDFRPSFSHMGQVIISQAGVTTIYMIHTDT